MCLGAHVFKTWHNVTGGGEVLRRWGKSAENLNPTNESTNSISPGSPRQSREGGIFKQG